MIDVAQLGEDKVVPRFLLSFCFGARVLAWFNFKKSLLTSIRHFKKDNLARVCCLSRERNQLQRFEVLLALPPKYMRRCRCAHLAAPALLHWKESRQLFGKSSSRRGFTPRDACQPTANKNQFVESCTCKNLPFPSTFRHPHWWTGDQQQYTEMNANLPSSHHGIVVAIVHQSFLTQKKKNQWGQCQRRFDPLLRFFDSQLRHCCLIGRWLLRGRCTDAYFKLLSSHDRMSTASKWQTIYSFL